MVQLSSSLSIALAAFLGLCMVFAVFCVIYVRRLSNYCNDAVNFVVTQNKNAVTLKRMADVEVALTDLTDSYDSLLSSHKKLRSRIGMRKTREDAKTEVDLTDKTQLRLAAKQSGLLR